MQLKFQKQRRGNRQIGEEGIPPARPPDHDAGAGLGARGLWPTCAWLVGTFFALAVFVQVNESGCRTVGGCVYDSCHSDPACWT